jgi:hypothetical protein
MWRTAMPPPAALSSRTWPGDRAKAPAPHTVRRRCQPPAPDATRWRGPYRAHRPPRPGPAF